MNLCAAQLVHFPNWIASVKCVTVISSSQMMICTKKEAAEAASFLLLTLAPSAILSVSAACIAAAGIISITAWVTSARFTAHFPARREKFIHRELETIEYITRVLCIICAVAAAFTLRHADIKRRHQQLNIPLETQN